MDAKICLALLLVMSGCATPNFSQRSSMELCMTYMTNPSNIWNSDRAAELNRRGEDCSQYAGIAAARNQSRGDALDQIQQGLAAMGQARQQPPSKPVVNCTSTRWGNQVDTTCR